MEEWQSALLVAAIAAVAGLVGAVIGRERWPADLRDAKRLGEVVDKMEPGTKEREFAAMYRDDLTSRWLISRVVARNDFRRELGLILMPLGFLITVGGFVAGTVGAFAVSSDAPREVLVQLLAFSVAGLTLGPLACGVGLWSGSAYLKRWSRYLTDLRQARGMRAPVADWVSDFDKSYKHSRNRATTAARPTEPTQRDGTPDTPLTP